MVAEVLPDSPAQASGIQPHDILVALDNQRLAHVDQLMALVRERKKGDQIVLTLKRGGTEQKVNVTVGEKNMPVSFRGEPGGPGVSFWGGGGDGDRRFQFRFDGERAGEVAGEWREHLEHLRRMLEEYRERLQDWARGPKDAPMPEAPRFDAPGRREGKGAERPEGGGAREGERKDGAGAQRPASQAEASVEVRVGEDSKMFQRNVTRRDDTGEYVLRQENGKTTYTVRPKDGKEQTFEVTTPEQRGALPAPFREKLHEMEKINPKPGADAAPPKAGERKAQPADGGKGAI
jgi:membrane-associated protease RseP (regulator of RpoE activity)